MYAIFPTSGATAAEIYSIVWEGIGRLEMLLGLKVRMYDHSVPCMWESDIRCYENVWSSLGAGCDL